jgi:hypothetical protein
VVRAKRQQQDDRDRNTEEKQKDGAHENLVWGLKNRQLRLFNATISTAFQNEVPS